jgi:HSP20 family protein
MSALTRLDPLDDMLPQLFRGFLTPLAQRGGPGEPGDIRIDVSESEQAYTVQAEIPGAKKDDIRVAVDGNVVSISAEVRGEKEEKDEKNARVLVRERYYGSSSRSFRLASPVDETAAEAKFDNGVLKLTLPKRAGGSSKLLAIR